MVGALRSRGCSPCPAACGGRGGFATRLVHVYANFLQQGNESTDANIVSVQPPCNEMIELLI